MEGLNREFNGEPVKELSTHEAPLRKRPGDLPLNEHFEMLWQPTDRSTQSCSRGLSSIDARGSLSALHNRGNVENVGSQHLRPSQSRDDLVLSQLQRSKEKELEQRYQREMDELRAQLREANHRAKQAERAVDQLARELAVKSNEITATVGGNLAEMIDALKTENKGLKRELDEARSHIFSLQPYRKDLTPKEVGQDFDDLVHGITDWISSFMDPILDDENKRNGVVEAAKKRPADIQKLRMYLRSEADLAYGCMFPETDVDILIAVTMRWLQDQIFQRILFGLVPEAVEIISFVEGSMQTNVEPKRDLFALRTWRAEALNALICSPDYQQARLGRIRELTADVASLFKVFNHDKDWNRLCHACQESIIKPALKLHEKLMTSTHHFYLDLNPYIVWNSQQELEMSPEFLQDLPKLKCENILQNRRPFGVAKLEPRPSKQQLYKELLNVATVVPALYMRKVGKGDNIKEPTVVRMQHVLVAWGPEEKRKRFLANGERTLLHQLCFTRRNRQERAQEGDG
ncbi:hypothetical protein MYCTH_2113928 [Thermothelomyces thermophilus ATCC 42464]|uniref:Uncharacterized protein n=1 Tax=Thermothelomyces thermophilus (strain ATCC 42464 / BCRC 31852 / DSM 1799) TaxID=573729 RepID=G2QNJ1_THET4|nr:uncharacterized protein MYCTH_2113928 [Thermothelomyces thermophilus ATCC 42464]AEO62064.1 hypothetical protein MYCTH_2113928 [Thermothelomyces thermophilus ATCC 42464]